MGYKCPATLVCGSSYDFSDIIINTSAVTFYEDFNWGLTNFDDMFSSLFTVFIVINGNWKALVQMLSDSGSNVVAIIYCFVTYIVCKFFIIQLAVAVMLDNCSRLREKENPKKVVLTNSYMLKDGAQEKFEARSFEVIFCMRVYIV